MAFRILTNRDLSVEDLKNIVASSNGNSLTTNKTNQQSLGVDVFRPLFFVEQASVSFDQFCCILTEFRNLPPDNQRRLWDVMVSKAATLLYSVVSPVSRILCNKKKSFFFFFVRKIFET